MQAGAKQSHSAQSEMSATQSSDTAIKARRNSLRAFIWNIWNAKASAVFSGRFGVYFDLVSRHTDST